MQTVLVAGATGYMGRYLVSELHRRGYRVNVNGHEVLPVGGQ